MLAQKVGIGCLGGLSPLKEGVKRVVSLPHPRGSQTAASDPTLLPSIVPVMLKHYSDQIRSKQKNLSSLTLKSSAVELNLC